MWQDFWDAFIYFPDDPFKYVSLKANLHIFQTGIGAPGPNAQSEAVALTGKRFLAWAEQKDDDDGDGDGDDDGDGDGDDDGEFQSLVGETEARVRWVRHARCPKRQI